MADIRCPSCGKNNPDFLDHCQFCQSPLKPESILRAGETPTKKHTGELEPVLPEWLRDLRQQARQSAEEEAVQQAARPKEQKDEPPDLLAGLASQAGAEDDEIPDWLASIGPTAKAASETPVEENRQSLMEDSEDQSEEQEEKDELSAWLSEASQEPSEPFTLEPGVFQDDPDWMSNLGSTTGSPGEPSAPKEEEDLSWLHNLEASAKQSAEPAEPGRDTSRTPGSASTQPFSEEQDLGWLNNLGGLSEPAAPFDPSGRVPAQDQPAPAESSAPQDDLSWLENLGGTEPLQPPQSPPPAEDLSWLNNLAGTSKLSQPQPEKSSSPEDPGWLNTLGRTPESLQDEPAQPLSDTESMFDAPDSSSEIFSPRRTAPLGEEALDESLPDWLKSATEKPSMPPLGAEGLDWLASHDLDRDQPSLTQESPTSPPQDISGEGEPATSPPSDQPQEIPVFVPPSETTPASDQDVDSLFSMDMPDWLSSPEAGTGEDSTREAETPPVESGDSLAPVELPSWVQAMRPVEAVLSETGPGAAEQAPEKEGPLAGLGGVIPLLPIGSTRRPKALSLTLQTTDEQRTGAAILEEILTSETSPRPLVAPASVSSQNILRWTLAGVVLLVLGLMIGLRSQRMPVSSALPVEAGAASNAIANIAEGAPVLVIVDYEPARAAEMEVLGGALLNTMVSSRRPTLSFLSTSPNGPALAERLMVNTQLNNGSQGVQYSNLGYLPGGSAGVLAFIESPQTAVPAARIESFSQYAAVIVLTDHAESGRAWVEQLEARRQTDLAFANQPMLVAASAQAGPLLQPYVSSRQVTGMISGLPDAARYEAVNNISPGIARSYWDAFGVGLLLAIVLIVFGSLWSLLMSIRPRRAGTE
ncbi:MAG TPA: hypothetical protein VFO91_13930 [Anaerolineales bacterium]|nr:hypothetical protein [Anaerolineales bacterium]